MNAEEYELNNALYVDLSDVDSSRPPTVRDLTSPSAAYILSDEHVVPAHIAFPDDFAEPSPRAGLPTPPSNTTNLPTPPIGNSLPLTFVPDAELAPYCLPCTVGVGSGNAPRLPREIMRMRERFIWICRVKKRLNTEETIDTMERYGWGRCTPGAVQAAVRRVGERLEKAFREEAAVEVAAQLEQADSLARTAAESFDRSRQGTITEMRISGRIMVPRNGNPVALPDEVTRTIVSSPGDPRFLDTQLKAMDVKRRILGIEAAKKTDVTSNGLPVKAYVGVNVDDI